MLMQRSPELHRKLQKYGLQFPMQMTIHPLNILKARYMKAHVDISVLTMHIENLRQILVREATTTFYSDTRTRHGAR